MKKLLRYGLKNFISQTQYSDLESNKNIGRVISIKGNIFEIITEKGIIRSELLGKLLFAFEKSEQPKVGDWITYIDYEDVALIENVLPRFNQLYRKTAGKEYSKQVMVANVDQAVIIQGLDNDFNLNRIERYIVQAVTCNIMPVVILNKSDLVDNIADYVNEIERLKRQISVYSCSLKTGVGLDEIKNVVFKPQLTSVLIGSSGVGKSSLINTLVHIERKTKSISHSTGKGKHTTTTRDLFLLENGSIVIDTPGMREFGVGFETEANFEDQFPVISHFAKGCRYKDCQHISEEGCNVIKAYDSGDLDPIVYESYLKLLKEQKRFQTSSQDKKRQGKHFGKMVKEAKDYRKKYKY